jgi:(+)-trans-carveol dehydrogenase
VSRRFEDKVCLITGAARGQGRSHAIRMAAEGADVIVLDICRPLKGSPAEGATVADLAHTVELVERAGRHAVPRVVDIRDGAALRTAVDEAVGELGRLDVVVANAGLGAITSKVHEFSDELWRDMLDVNLTGAWLTIKATAPHLISSGRGGAIVLTSSIAGHRGTANIANYAAAKHGVDGLMRTTAIELAPFGIRVNSISPTQVNTPMIHNEGTYRIFCPDQEQVTREDFARASTRTHALPVPWIEPEDVTNALLFLASDEARYITGVPLPVDAGALLI